MTFRCRLQIAIYDGRRILALPPARMEEVAADHVSGPLLWAPDGRSILHQAHIELSGLMGGPLVVTPLSGTPQVVTVEFGIVSYDWQPVPVR
ncbi:MAG TPA: hypothetical protein VJR05_10520 [Acidimicrobiia bacterium]|nr:hypothetical protein [Acidimicrobiia bacterium]